MLLCSKLVGCYYSTLLYSEGTNSNSSSYAMLCYAINTTVKALTITVSRALLPTAHATNR